VHCADAVFALIQAVIAERAAPSRKPIALFNVLTQWIEEQLTEHPDATTLAAAHHLSTRYVRQIFASNGTTVSRFARERRLEHARADLVNPKLAMVGVGVLARKWVSRAPRCSAGPSAWDSGEQRDICEEQGDRDDVRAVVQLADEQAGETMRGRREPTDQHDLVMLEPHTCRVRRLDHARDERTTPMRNRVTSLRRIREPG
jgi:AraC-like DNA-binding protein